VTATECVIAENSCTRGAGLYLHSSAARLIDSQFVANRGPGAAVGTEPSVRSPIPRPDRSFSRVVLWAAAVTALVASPAAAVVVASDGFDYPDGSLFGRDGGFGWVTGWAGFLTDVVAHTAVGQSHVQFTGTRVFTNPQSTLELFVAFTVHVPVDLALDDFIGVHLNAGVNGSNLTVGKIPGSPYFVVGNGGLVESSIVVAPGSTYRVIGVYDLDQSRTSMWIDPDGSDYYDPATGSSSADATGIFSLFGHMDWLAFQGSVAGMGFDDIVIANAPQDIGLSSRSPASAPDGPSLDPLTVTISPNPCRDVLRLDLSSSRSGAATFTLHDAAGRRVARTELTIPEGETSRSVSVSQLPEGTYFYRIRTAKGEVLGKCVLRR
jgi:hypothetical protein